MTHIIWKFTDTVGIINKWLHCSTSIAEWMESHVTDTTLSQS